MIKKLLSIVAIAAIFTSCGGGAGTEQGEQTEETTIQEEMVVEIQEINLGEFETKAGEFVDKEIMIAGVVDHICRHGGKRLLLVTDDGDVHVDAEERFSEDLNGSHVMVNGIVREFRVDEAYCLKMEEDNIKSHTEGDSDDEHYQHKMEEIQWYRDSMSTAGVDHLSFYSLDYVSLIVQDSI